MSFNGSGTYTLPAGNPVAVNTTVDATVHNNTNADIATALSNCVTRDGQSLPTADLPMGGHKLTGLSAGAGNGESVRYEQVGALATTQLASTVTFKTATTGSAVIPARTTAQRDAADPSPANGLFGLNLDTNTFEGYANGVWGTVGGSAGATGAGVGNAQDHIFNQTDQLVTDNWTIGQDGMVSGVTISIANPAVFTLTKHGFVSGQPIRLTTTGALPAPVTSTAQLFVKTVLTADTFTASATSGGTELSTLGGTQSGVHSVGKSKDSLVTKSLNVLTGKSVTVPTGSSLVVVGAGNPTLADLYVNTSTAQIVNGVKNFSSAPLWNGADITGIGVGQSWQNVTASRAVGTTYTNTTGKPIQIAVSVSNATTGAGSNLLVNGSIIAMSTQVYSSTALGGELVAVIPVGNTYAITTNGGTTSIPQWWELR